MTEVNLSLVEGMAIMLLSLEKEGNYICAGFLSLAKVGDYDVPFTGRR